MDIVDDEVPKSWSFRSVWGLEVFNGREMNLRETDAEGGQPEDWKRGRVPSVAQMTWRRPYLDPTERRTPRRLSGGFCICSSVSSGWMSALFAQGTTPWYSRLRLLKGLCHKLYHLIIDLKISAHRPKNYLLYFKTSHEIVKPLNFKLWWDYPVSYSIYLWLIF